MKSDVMHLNVKNGTAYLRYKVFDGVDFVNHAISTRHGGISQGKAIGGLNLGFNAKDTKENVTENYKRFCKVTGFDTHNLVFGVQTHSSNVRYVTEADRGKGIYFEKDYNDVDALITDKKNVSLVIHTADCVPIAFVDTVNKAIGNAHCGWRGTYDNLAKKTLDEMKSMFQTNPKDVICTIGPAICRNCYEVSEELYSAFMERFGFEDAIIVHKDRFYLDLMLINKHILKNCGVQNIILSDLCTMCNCDNLYSHRGLGPGRGLMSSIIEIK